MRIFIAGHRGMVGSALVRLLRTNAGVEIVTRTRAELDLQSQAAVNEFFNTQSIDQVYLAAAKVGGIAANSHYPVEFLLENLAIQNNVIHAAHEHGVNRLLFLGSSCIYPKLANQPITEDQLLTGSLEPTNEAYAIAKIAGLKLCAAYRGQYGADFRAVMPTNLYGPEDRFHPEDSHVIPALMRRIHEAKEAGDPEVPIWGSGTPRREFLHVDDMARACEFVMNLSADAYDLGAPEPTSFFNVGVGADCSIRELATTLCDVVGYQGSLVFDRTRPDGTPRKLLSCDRLTQLGWVAQCGLKEGLASTYEWYCAHAQQANAR